MNYDRNITRRGVILIVLEKSEAIVFEQGVILEFVPQYVVSIVNILKCCPIWRTYRLTYN